MNKEYHKKYYEEHKKKMIEQARTTQGKQRLRNIIEKLNNGEYKRFPYSIIEKHNIKFNKETNKYFI